VASETRPFQVDIMFSRDTFNPLPFLPEATI
jgi:hypothetical protein